LGLTSDGGNWDIDSECRTCLRTLGLTYVGGNGDIDTECMPLFLTLLHGVSNSDAEYNAEFRPDRTVPADWAWKSRYLLTTPCFRLHRWRWQ